MLPSHGASLVLAVALAASRRRRRVRASAPPPSASAAKAKELVGLLQSKKLETVRRARSGRGRTLCGRAPRA